MAELGRLIAEGDFPHSMEFYSNWFALVGTGYVVEGEGNECRPTITGTENRTVQVDTGEICLGYGNRQARDSVDSVVLESNPSDYDRYDVIYLQDDGAGGWEIFDNLAVIQGTPSDEPKHPDIPMPSARKIVPICVVYWEGQSDEITAIKDCRTVMHDWMKDAAGTLHRWERTGMNSNLADKGIALRPEITPADGDPILSVLNAEGSPRLLVGENTVLGTSNPQIKTGILEDGSGGNMVCDEGKIGEGLAYLNGHFQTDIGSGLQYDANSITVDLDTLSGDGLHYSGSSLKINPIDFAGSGLGVYDFNLLINLAEVSGLDIINDELLINAGNGLDINTQNELELVDQQFLDLIDTPTDYTGNGGKVLMVKDDETGIDYSATQDITTEFLELNDTPADYTGDGGKLLKVADTEDGVEFIESSNDPMAKRLFDDGSFYYRFDFDESFSNDADSNTYEVAGGGTFELDYFNGYVKLSDIDFAKNYSKGKELGETLLSFTKRQGFKTVIEMSDVTNGDLRIVRGRPFAATVTPRGFGFKVTGGKVYGVCGSLANGEVELELCSAANDTRIKLEVELFPGDHIDFYVNGVLEGSTTNGLPVADQDDYFGHRLFYFKEIQGNSNVYMTFYEFWMEE